MKFYSIFILTFCFSVLCFGQKKKSSSITILDSITLIVGQELTVGKPISYSEFSFVEKKKKGFKLKNITNSLASVGSSLASVGIGTNSIDMINTGVKVSNNASAASSVLDVVEIVEKPLNPLTGKSAIIVKLNEDDSSGEIDINGKIYTVSFPEAVLTKEIRLKR